VEQLLQEAASRGHERIVQLLIDNAAYIDEGGHRGTALQIAVSRGHQTVAQLLIQYGAQEGMVEESWSDGSCPCYVIVRLSRLNHEIVSIPPSPTIP